MVRINFPATGPAESGRSSERTHDRTNECPENVRVGRARAFIASSFEKVRLP